MTVVEKILTGLDVVSRTMGLAAKTTFFVVAIFCAGVYVGKGIGDRSRIVTIADLKSEIENVEEFKRSMAKLESIGNHKEIQPDKGAK